MQLKAKVQVYNKTKPIESGFKADMIVFLHGGKIAPKWTILSEAPSDL